MVYTKSTGNERSRALVLSILRSTGNKVAQSPVENEHVMKGVITMFYPNYQLDNYRCTKRRKRRTVF